MELLVTQGLFISSGKIITTGEGGAIIVKNKNIFHKLKSIKSFGYDVTSPQKEKFLEIIISTT